MKSKELIKMFKKFDKDDLIKISSNEHLSNDIRKIADIELYKRMKRERKRIKKGETENDD